MRVTPRGAPLLIRFIRWRFPDDGPGNQFFREMDAEPSLQRLKERHPILDVAARKWREEWHVFSDSAAVLFDEGRPLKDALASKDAELPLAQLQRAQSQAAEVVAALIDLSRKPRPLLPAFAIDFRKLERFPSLAAVLSRPLMSRFVPPMWMSAPTATTPGRGAWHPVLATLDDFLTWATADVLATDSARRLGQCDYCKRYYYSKRDKSHRFCPDEDCRDLYWRHRSGAARVQKSRRIQKKGQQ